jgi:hypothetical protein
MKHLLSMAALMAPLSVSCQQYFPKQIPAGHYSGITSVGNDCFAVVDDKALEDGFYVFRLPIDSEKLRIMEAENLGYHSSGFPNRDMESICFCPTSQTLFVSGEEDNEVYEYTLEGKRTGRRLAMPAEYGRARGNFGLEALTYDDFSHQFFVTTERPLRGDSLLRIQAFGEDLQPSSQYLYRPDKPISRKYYQGVSEMCSTGDGHLLVMECQTRVPRLKLFARTVIRIYEVDLPSGSGGFPPDGNAQLLEKRLLKEFSTRLTLFGRKFAIYEGICRLSPGRYLLIADSQGRYKNVLRDWLLLLDI